MSTLRTRSSYGAIKHWKSREAAVLWLEGRNDNITYELQRMDGDPAVWEPLTQYRNGIHLYRFASGY